MTNEELNQEVEYLRKALVVAVETTADQIEEFRAAMDVLITNMQGTIKAQEAVIHTLLTPLLRDNPFNQQRFELMLDEHIAQQQVGLDARSVANFETTIRNFRQTADMHKPQASK